MRDQMRLQSIVERRIPAPWAEGDNIPWHDPEFSARMLREHLSQAHDAASRRFATIDQHIQFLFQQALGGKPGHVLDLGCGPGLYLERLARLGCSGRGVDFSPASIAYARQVQQTGSLPIEYILADMREADFGGPFDLVCLLFGEMNVFPPAQVRALLARIFNALRPGGVLALEPSQAQEIRSMGMSQPAWSAQPAGLFSDRPHLVLEEAFWDETASAATHRFYIIDAASGAVERYAASYQAYSDDELCLMLTEAGFEQIVLYPNLTGAGERQNQIALLSQKPVPR